LKSFDIITEILSDLFNLSNPNSLGNKLIYIRKRIGIGVIEDIAGFTDGFESQEAI